MSTLTEVAQFFESASIVVASFAAMYGFDAWRREHIGKRRIELAEEVLALFYQAKDAIDAMRSPFGYGGEGQSRKADADELPEHKEALDRAFVLIERYNRYSDVFAKLHALRYRFIAQNGPDKAEPFDGLNVIVNELIGAARKMARLATLPEWSLRTPEAEERHNRQLLELDAIYYGTGGADDPISPRVEKVLGRMEATCREIIESRRTLFAVINARLGRRS